MFAASTAQGYNWYDWVWIVAFLFGLWNGVRTGFLGEIVRVVGWVLMLWLAVTYYKPFGDWIGPQFTMAEEPARLEAFVVLMIGAYLLSLLVRKLFAKWTARAKTAAFVANFGGAALGLFRMTMVMIFVTIVLSMVRSPFLHWHVSKNSTFGAMVVNEMPDVAVIVKKNYVETCPLFRDIERPLDVDEDVLETNKVAKPKR